MLVAVIDVFGLLLLFFYSFIIIIFVCTCGSPPNFNVSGIVENSVVYAGLLSVNIQILGAFATCFDPNARESQFVAETHALWISQV